MGLMFFVSSILTGGALAMDAFSVSVANGLNEPCMKKRKIFAIAIVFAVFQALMPLIGWVCVHTILEHFKIFEYFIPWIALILLSYIGFNMIKEGKDTKVSCNCSAEGEPVKVGALMVQGIATSIDALSAGFTIAEHNFFEALVCVLIIAIVTFAICLAGVVIGKKVGMKFCGKANIFGGIILILIGLEIFITGLFF